MILHPTNPPTGPRWRARKRPCFVYFSSASEGRCYNDHSSGAEKYIFFMLFEKHLVCCCLLLLTVLYFFPLLHIWDPWRQHKKLFPFMHDELQMFSKGTMWPTRRFLHSFTVNSCCWDTFITWSGNKAPCLNQTCLLKASVCWRHSVSVEMTQNTCINAHLPHT